MPNVRFGSKADMCSAKGHVRFAPESGHVRCNSICPLWAKKRTSSDLFDHLVSAILDRLRHGNAECFGGLEIDIQLDFSGLLDR